jgi:hypothetical protein
MTKQKMSGLIAKIAGIAKIENRWRSGRVASKSSILAILAISSVCRMLQS